MPRTANLPQHFWRTLLNSAPQNEQAAVPVFDVPKIKNPLWYAYHIFLKYFSFFLFGFGSVLLSIIAIPVMKLFWPKKEAFQKKAHAFVSFLFKFFVTVLRVTGGVKMSVNDIRKLRSLKGGVLVANHPSLLDVVFLISMISNADAIVNSKLAGRNILHFIINNLYISNSLEYEALIERCSDTIKNGNVLIIFPEGTRTKTTGQNPYKKGAARIALAAGCPIYPVFIGGNDKRGLRKGDSMLMYNTASIYDYRFYLKDPILVDEFKNEPGPAAAKHLTQKIHDALCYENNLSFLYGLNPLNPLVKSSIK